MKQLIFNQILNKSPQIGQKVISTIPKIISNIPAKTVYLQGVPTAVNNMALGIHPIENTHIITRPQFFENINIPFYQYVGSMPLAMQKAAEVLGYKKNDRLNTQEVTRVRNFLRFMVPQDQYHLVEDVIDVTPVNQNQVAIRTQTSTGPGSVMMDHDGTIFNAMSDFNTHRAPDFRGFQITDKLFQHNWNKNIPLAISGSGLSAITTIRECIKSGRKFYLLDGKEGYNALQKAAEGLKVTGVHDEEIAYILSPKFKNHCLPESFIPLNARDILIQHSTSPNDETLQHRAGELRKFLKKHKIKEEDVLGGNASIAAFIDTKSNKIGFCEAVNCIGYKPKEIPHPKGALRMIDVQTKFAGMQDFFVTHQSAYGSQTCCLPINVDLALAPSISQDQQLLLLGARMHQPLLTPSDSKLFISLCRKAGVQADDRVLEKFFKKVCEQIKEPRTHKKMDEVLKSVAKEMTNEMRLSDLKKIEDGARELMREADRRVSRKVDQRIAEVPELQDMVHDKGKKQVNSKL